MSLFNCDFCESQNFLDGPTDNIIPIPTLNPVIFGVTLSRNTDISYNNTGLELISYPKFPNQALQCHNLYRNKVQAG